VVAVTLDLDPPHLGQRVLMAEQDAPAALAAPGTQGYTRGVSCLRWLGNHYAEIALYVFLLMWLAYYSAPCAIAAGIGVAYGILRGATAIRR